MVDISREHDIEVLRQVAHLLDRENQRLHARIRVQAEKLTQASGDPTVLQRELIALQEILAQREKALFGDSRERRAHLREQEAKEKASVKPSRRGHGPQEQPELPVIEKLHDLDDADKICTSCGGALEEWPGKFEESEEIDVVERQFVVTKHKRKKYRCACGGCVETALGPDKLRPNNRYSIEFAIDVAVSKYLDHLPLERQVRIMRRQGLKVDSQTLWDQLDALAKLFIGTEQRLIEYLLKKPVIGADETHWHMLNRRGQDEVNTRWYVWAVAGEDAVAYRIFDTRSQKAAEELLKSYSGTVMTDGYAVYQSLIRKAKAAYKLAHCWSHARRKFLEAEPFYSREANAILNLIDELFAVERLCPTGPPDDAARLAFLAKLRAEKSATIIEALKLWVLAPPQSALPNSSLGKAISYMAELWPGLVSFLDDPRIPLTNNGTERGLRGIVVGRKNHYGSKSKRGTEVAALFYSLMESAKLAGLEPKAYLRQAVAAAIKKEAVPLPHEIAASLAKSTLESPAVA
jgi:transposase